jgi:hypothetical protein
LIITQNLIVNISAAPRGVRAGTHRRPQAAHPVPKGRGQTHRQNRAPRNIFDGFRRWPKTLPDFAFGKACLAAISECHPTMAAVDPFRPGENVTRKWPEDGPLRRLDSIAFLASTKAVENDPGRICMRAFRPMIGII